MPMTGMIQIAGLNWTILRTRINFRLQRKIRGFSVLFRSTLQTEKEKLSFSFSQHHSMELPLCPRKTKSMLVGEDLSHVAFAGPGKYQIHLRFSAKSVMLQGSHSNVDWAYCWKYYTCSCGIALTANVCTQEVALQQRSTMLELHITWYFL
jgi:hypothetical protein